MFVFHAGTPRQGTLVPSTRGIVTLDSAIGFDALDGLQEYTHVWLVYVFHKNTNFYKHEQTHKELQHTAAINATDDDSAPGKSKKGKQRQSRMHFMVRMRVLCK